MKIIPGPTSISLNDRFNITVVAPYSRTLKIGEFPEIPDFAKGNTEFLKEDSVIRIVQHYRPRKHGTFILDPFNIWLNEERIHFPGTIQIEVLNKGSIIPDTTQHPEDFTKPALKARLETEVSQNDIYTGGALTVAVSLLIREDNEADYNFIELRNQILAMSKQMIPENSVAENLSLSSVIRSDSVVKAGKSYKRYVLLKETFYPISSNNIRFEKLNFRLLGYSKNRKPGLISRKDTIYILQSDPVTVKVKPLPDHPKDFAAIPGNFRLSEKVSKDKIVAGESFTYQFVISGEGNLLYSPEPIINPGPDLEIYPDRGAKSPSNKKVFSYSIVPKKAGRLAMQSKIYWPYYNTVTNQYDTLKPREILNIYETTAEALSSVEKDPFYQLITRENNKLTELREDNMLKIFTNLVILFMFAVTALLIIRR